MSQPIKVIKPVLITWVLLVSYIPLQLNLTFVGGGVCGSIGFLYLLWSGANFELWTPFIFFGLGFFICTPLLIYFVRKRTYDETDYKFFKDRLEYSEGFWTIEHKLIKYSHITQVTVRKNVIQRIYGLGTIYLSVPTMPATRGGFAGIAIADIKNPDQVYMEIKQILGADQ